MSAKRYKNDYILLDFDTCSLADFNNVDSLCQYLKNEYDEYDHLMVITPSGQRCGVEELSKFEFPPL